MWPHREEEQMKEFSCSQSFTVKAWALECMGRLSQYTN